MGFIEEHLPPLYFLYWVYQQIGFLGIFFGLALLIGGAVLVIIYGEKKEEKEEAEAFNNIVLYSLHNRTAPAEAKRTNGILLKSRHPGLALVRYLQKMKDSIDLALSSKSRDLAEKKIVDLNTYYKIIKTEHAFLISETTMNEIDLVVQKTNKRFHTKLYQNLAHGHLDKAKKLKTNKSKEKYAKLAADIISEGLDNPESDKPTLEREQERITQYLESLSSTA